MGPDGVSPFCIKKALSIVSDLATEFFNLSLQCSQYPTVWKKTLIIHLSKIRTPKSPSDTRPIANLSELSKLFERIIHK